LVSLAAQGYYSVNVTLAKTESQLKKLKENKRPGEGGIPEFVNTSSAHPSSFYVS